MDDVIGTAHPAIFHWVFMVCMEEGLGIEAAYAFAVTAVTIKLQDEEFGLE